MPPQESCAGTWRYTSLERLNPALVVAEGRTLPAIWTHLMQKSEGRWQGTLWVGGGLTEWGPRDEQRARCRGETQQLSQTLTLFPKRHKADCVSPPEMVQNQIDPLGLCYPLVMRRVSPCPMIVQQQPQTWAGWQCRPACLTGLPAPVVN